MFWFILSTLPPVRSRRQERSPPPSRRPVRASGTDLPEESNRSSYHCEDTGLSPSDLVALLYFEGSIPGVYLWTAPIPIPLPFSAWSEEIGSDRKRRSLPLLLRSTEHPGIYFPWKESFKAVEVYECSSSSFPSVSSLWNRLSAFANRQLRSTTLTSFSSVDFRTAPPEEPPASLHQLLLKTPKPVRFLLIKTRKLTLDPSPCRLRRSLRRRLSSSLSANLAMTPFAAIFGRTGQRFRNGLKTSVSTKSTFLTRPSPTSSSAEEHGGSRGPQVCEEKTLTNKFSSESNTFLQSRPRRRDQSRGSARS